MTEIIDSWGKISLTLSSLKSKLSKHPTYGTFRNAPFPVLEHILQDFYAVRDNLTLFTLPILYSSNLTLFQLKTLEILSNVTSLKSLRLRKLLD